MRIEQGFQTIPFQEGNAYTTDVALPSLLKRLLPKSIHEEVEPDLVRLGDEVITSIRAIGSRGKASPPQLIQYDQWGRRIDELQTSEAWRNYKTLAQKEGLPAIFYERKYREHSRVYGFAKAILMTADTHGIFCPIGMTDGTARVIELQGTPEMKKEILPRLISRDPSFAFTSGQWMTERPGGSDVSLTETTATSTGTINKFGPEYVLDGFKWFSSATDSDVSVALARTGSVADGSRAISLFLIPLRLPLIRDPSIPPPQPTSNNIFVHRLKNKVGTQTLPTAELSLESAQAYLVGNLNQGVKNITPVLNITRVWSATASVGQLRKCLAIATAFAKVRAVKSGTTVLKDAPIHVAQLATINILYRGLLHLVFGVIALLGKADCGVASPDELRRLRMLTPVVKAYAAERVSAGIEEAMTTLGGAGYMEENGFGLALRDALVEKIWEGTTTVLSLDLERATRDPDSIGAFVSWAEEVINSCPQSMLPKVKGSLDIMKEALAIIAILKKPPTNPLLPRPALMLVGICACSLYLLEQAIWSHKNIAAETEVDVEVFRRWVSDGGVRVAIEDVGRIQSSVNQRISYDSMIVFGEVVKPRL